MGYLSLYTPFILISAMKQLSFRKKPFFTSISPLTLFLPWSLIFLLSVKGTTIYSAAIQKPRKHFLTSALIHPQILSVRLHIKPKSILPPTSLHDSWPGAVLSQLDYCNNLLIGLPHSPLAPFKFISTQQTARSFKNKSNHFDPHLNLSEAPPELRVKSKTLALASRPSLLL